MEEIIQHKENATECFTVTDETKTSWGIFYNGFYTDISGEISIVNVDDISDTFTVYITSDELQGDNAETSDLPNPPESPKSLNPPESPKSPDLPDSPDSPEPCRKTNTKSDRSARGSQTERKSISVSKKDICKKARNSGKSYVKLKGKEVGSFVQEKEIGEDCSCPNKCYERVGLDTIRKIFHDFWALGDYNSQNAYLFGLINLFGVKRRYTKNEKSRRNFTITYSVKKKGENVNVCKKAFLNIHGLQKNRGRINNLANKMKNGESVPPPDQRGRHTNRPNAYSEEAIFHVKNHLEQCPKVERKKNSSKPSKYMEYSTKRCYDLYVAVYCRDHNLLPVSLDKYRRIFWEEGYRNSQCSRKSPGNAIPSNVTIRKLS